MTIRKSQRGRWMIDAHIRLPNGSVVRVRKVSPVQSKRGASQYEREVRAAVLDGTWGKKEGEQSVQTLAEFATFFLETYATNNNRPSTVREKRRALDRGLLDELGHLRLDRIGTREIEAFKARRKNEGVGPKTINEELAILSKILGYAEEVGELTTRPPRVRRLKVPKPDYDFLDFDEAERLEEAAARAAEPWRTMIPTALWTGLRLGELRALRWDDVDLEARRLHVRQAADDEDVLHPPKSGKPRIIEIPRKAVRMLRAHKHLRGEYVFCHEDGSMLHNRDCESKSTAERHDGPLVKVCRKAGLRRIGWHGLRHTYASHLMMQGAMPVEVQELLGHASLSMTMRYTHLSPSARRAAADLLDEAPPKRRKGNAGEEGGSGDGRGGPGGRDGGELRAEMSLEATKARARRAPALGRARRGGNATSRRRL